LVAFAAAFNLFFCFFCRSGVIADSCTRQRAS
jgi:hypothetical protein